MYHAVRGYGVMGLTSSTLLILPKLWDRPAGATSVKSFMVVLASVSGGGFFSK